MLLGKKVVIRTKNNKYLAQIKGNQSNILSGHESSNRSNNDYNLKIATPATPHHFARSLPWPGPIAISKNKQLVELVEIGKEYKISFEVLVNHFKRFPYQSVIHFTGTGTGTGPAYHGQRTPAVWLKPDTRVHFSSAISGISTYDDICCIQAKKWTKIEISQTLVGGKVGNQCLHN